MIDKSVFIRRLICTVTSFVLALCLMCMALISTVFIASGKSFIAFAEDKSDYAEYSLVTLKTELEYLAELGKFSPDFFSSQIDEELYKSRVSEAFLANIKGDSLSYNIESVSKEFYDMTAKYVLAVDGEILPEDEDGLRGLSVECAQAYIKYSNPASVKLVVKYFPKIRKILLFAAIGVSILLFASVFLLVKLCFGKDLSKHLIFAFSGASLLSGVLPATLLLSKEINKISLTLPALHSFVVTFFEDVLKIPCFISLAFLVVSITLLVIKFVKITKAKE